MKERRILSRLREQYEQARSHLPAPVVDEQGGSTILVDERRGSAIKLDANGRIPASFALARQGSVTSPSTSYPHHTPGSGLYGAERRNSGANPSTGSVDRRSSTTELVLNPSSLGNNQWILEETELEKAIEEGRVDVNGWVRSEEAHKLDKLFVCQALMKCGDISNPVSTDRSPGVLRGAKHHPFRFSAVLIRYLATGQPCCWKNGLLKHS